MRLRHRIAALTVAVLAAGCAHVEAPPGGPEDRQPPRVLVTRPDTNAVVPGFDGAVVIAFDERISEEGVIDAVMVSPRTSPVAVDHGRDEIRVSLRQGWQPGQIYHVTVAPDVRDLFGNRVDAPIALVFSTGPPIPATFAAGEVIDRVTLRAVTDARIEAIRQPDSLVYAFPADSAGGFRLNRIPAGEYQIRAYLDINNNRALDSFEARDSSFVTISETTPVAVALRIVPPDSTAPVLESAVASSRGIQLDFDEELDPEQPLAVDQVTITDPAGTVVPLARIGVGDVALPGADSLVLPGLDTLPGAAAAGGLPRLPVANLLVVPVDSAALQPGTEYTVTASGIRNLVGLEGGGETTFIAPEAATPAVDPADPDAPAPAGADPDPVPGSPAADAAGAVAVDPDPDAPAPAPPAPTAPDLPGAGGP